MASFTAPRLAAALFALLLLNAFPTRAQETPYLEQREITVRTDLPWPSYDYTMARLRGEASFSIALFNRPLLAGQAQPTFDYFSPTSETWTAQAVSIPQMFSLSEIEVFDFDLDGDQDFIVDLVGPVTLYENIGEDGELAFAEPVLLMESPDISSRIYHADLNDDGYEDLLITGDYRDSATGENRYNAIWTALNNRGRGMILSDEPLALEDRWPVDVRDLDGDGRADLLLHGGFGPHSYSVRPGLEGGGFGEEVRLDWSAAGGGPSSLLFYDYDGDHQEDLLTVSMGEDCLEYRSSGSCSERQYMPVLNWLQPGAGFSFTLTRSDTLRGLPWDDGKEIILQPLDVTEQQPVELLYTLRSYGEDYEEPIPTLRFLLDLSADSLSVLYADTTVASGVVPFIRSSVGDYVRPNHIRTEEIFTLFAEYVHTDVAGTPPAAPTGLKAEVEGSHVRLTWSAPEAATPVYFHVTLEREDGGYRYDSKLHRQFYKGSIMTLGATAALERIFHGLPVGRYEATVRAVDAAGFTSEHSALVSFEVTTATPPAAPDEVTAETAEDGIRIGFSVRALYDSVRVYRLADGDTGEPAPIGTVRPPSGAYRDRSVTAGASYQYWLETYLDGTASVRTEPVTASAPASLLSVLALPTEGYALSHAFPYDLNLDGYEDVVVLQRRLTHNGSRVLLVPGSEQGLRPEAARLVLESPDPFHTLTAGDFNGDLHPDLIATGSRKEAAYQVHLLADGEVIGMHAFEGRPSSTSNYLSLWGGVSDLDFDGRVDLLLTDQEQVEIGWSEPDGTLTFTVLTTRSMLGYEAAVIDYDQDGDRDVVVDYGLSQAPVVFANQGARRFERKDVGLPPWHMNGRTPMGVYERVQPLWFDPDPYPDLLTQRTTPDEFGYPRTDSLQTDLFRYNATRGQYEPVEVDFGANPPYRPVRPVHLNDDGYVDLIGRSQYRLELWTNQENSTFSRQHYDLATRADITSLFSMDVDGDGDTDPFFSLTGGRELYFLKNDAAPNQPPTVPQNVRVEGEAGALEVAWDASSDDQSLPGHLAYSVALYAQADTLQFGGVHARTGRLVSTMEDYGTHSTRLVLPRVPSGTYTIKVAAVDPVGQSSGFSEGLEVEVTSTGVAERPLPAEPALSPVYPNPFRDAATLEYTVAAPGEVRLVVYNVLGQAVQVLADGVHAPGHYRVGLKAGGLAAGLYFCRLTTQERVLVEQVTIIK